MLGIPVEPDVNNVKRGLSPLKLYYLFLNFFNFLLKS